MTAQADLGGTLFGSRPALFAGHTDPPMSEVDGSHGTNVLLNNADAESLEAKFDDIAKELQPVRKIY